MNLSEIAFHFRKPLFLMLAVFVVYGFSSYFNLPAREDPEITIREALVTTHYPGMNPERVEQLITKKLEEQIRKIPEVKEIRSTSTTGLSTIHVEVQDRYFNLDAIWQDLRNKVSAAQSQLPDGTQPSQVNDEFGNVAVITLALTGDDFNMSAKNDFAQHIRDTLYGVEGTKKIEIQGVQAERIFLEISNAKLSQLGITPNELETMLTTQNIINPGGIVDTGRKSFTIEPTGNFNSIEELAATLVSVNDKGDVLPLSDIVSIRRDYIDPPQQVAYYNGKSAVIFAISMLSGYNVLEFSPRMKAAIEEVQQTLPIGLNLDIATYQAEQVANTVFGVSSSVMQTLVIVLAVVMLFLGIRTGLIVGTIVPLVMLVTLAIMNLTGMELERMSLATLIIALGLLVDNGIVIAEDFKRRLEEGVSREDALKQCGGELAIPLLISSLTSILVFLPLMLAVHVAGEYTRSVSLIIMISLLVSWVLALCVTPVLCYFFLKVEDSPNDDKSGTFDKVYGHYQGFLQWAVSHKSLFLGSMLAALLASGALLQAVPKQFFPDSDRTQLLVYAELPAGTSTRATDQRMRDMFDVIRNKDIFAHIDSFSGYVGYGGPRFVLSLAPEDPAENKGFMVLNIADAEHMDSTLATLRAELLQSFPDMMIRISRMFLGPTDSSKLEIQVKGPDADVLYAKAEEIEALFRTIPNTIDIRHNWENRTTKILVKVDQQRARRAGVTSYDISRSMQGYFDGFQISEFREGDEIIPIIFRAEGTERSNLDRMRSMNVYSSARGTNVPLFQIADFYPQNQYARIDRENMFRTITVEAKNTEMTAEDMKALLDEQVQEIATSLPLNHRIEYDGVITDSASAQKALSASVPMVIGLIIILLVIQFNSYRRALIIMLTIPLILVGAVLGLLVMSAPFGFMVTLGLYSLAGIIVNNGIVLIDRIDIERASGKSDYDALISACIMRLRPIAMTTVTTILGLLPLIITRDPLFYGMSNAMAFGLAVGTVLTLGVVPVLYAIFYNVNRPQEIYS